MSTAFIGDIHGCLGELRSVMARAAGKADQFVFLGDYVDRGPASRQVLEELLKIQTTLPGRAHFLRGNHDAAFLDVLDRDTEVDTYLKMGGAKTFRSYITPPYTDTLNKLRSAVPRSHRDFLASLEPMYTAPGVVAVHDAKDAPRDGRFVISGHTTQTALVPRISDTAAYIDTGCGTRKGGRLTCLVWPSLEWWQSET